MNFYSEFPKLESMKNNLDSKVTSLKSKKEALEHNPRFSDNEAEREHQMTMLDVELEKTLQSADIEYSLELDAINLSLAEQAFEMPESSEEELTNAKSSAETIRMQLLSSFKPNDMLPLLVTRVSHMNDIEKSALALHLDDIATHAKDKAQFKEDRQAVDKHISEIQEQLQDTKHHRTIKEQQDALYKIHKGASSLRGYYDGLEVAKEVAKRSSFISN